VSGFALPRYSVEPNLTDPGRAQSELMLFVSGIRRGSGGQRSSRDSPISLFIGQFRSHHHISDVADQRGILGLSALSLDKTEKSCYFFLARLAAITFGWTVPAPSIPKPTFGRQTLQNHFPVGGCCKPAQARWNHSREHSSFC